MLLAHKKKEKTKITYFIKKLSRLLSKKGKHKVVIKKIFQALRYINYNTKLLSPRVFYTVLFFRIFVPAEIKIIRRGSKKYEVPFPLKRKRTYSLGLRWIVNAIRSNKKKMSLFLTIREELFKISIFKGEVYKKRRALLKKIKDNRRYKHFRWFKKKKKK